jgi:hypothetical protein
MDTGFRDTGFGRDTGGTTGYGVLGSHFPYCPAQFFVQSGPKGDNERRGCVQWPSCTGVGGQG